MKDLYDYLKDIRGCIRANGVTFAKCQMNRAYKELDTTEFNMLWFKVKDTIVASGKEEFNKILKIQK